MYKKFLLLGLLSASSIEIKPVEPLTCVFFVFIGCVMPKTLKTLGRYLFNRQLAQLPNLNTTVHSFSEGTKGLISKTATSMRHFYQDPDKLTTIKKGIDYSVERMSVYATSLKIWANANKTANAEGYSKTIRGSWTEGAGVQQGPGVHNLYAHVNNNHANGLFSKIIHNNNHYYDDGRRWKYFGLGSFSTMLLYRLTGWDRSKEKAHKGDQPQVVVRVEPAVPTWSSKVEGVEGLQHPGSKAN